MTGAEQPRGETLYPAALMASPSVPDWVDLTENISIPMRDGIRLAADLYRPRGAGPWPVLLSQSPYSKDIQQKPPYWSHAIESGATLFYVGNDYVHVIAQSRGAGRSQGKWEFFGPRERSDGYDLIEWIAAQPWCDGNVGMIGDSYWSWSQYHAAGQRPPHLRCICQCDATADLYRDLCYQGGVYHHQFMSQWIPYHTAMMAWPGPIEGKDEPMNMTWVAANHPCDGPFWHERSGHSQLGSIEVPVLSLAPQGGQTHFRGQLSAWPQLQGPKKLYILPPTGFWSHLRYLTDPALNAQMLRWFDHWMKGRDTGLMDEPEVAFFDSGTRRWHQAARYPLPETQWTPLYLRASEPGSLALSTAAPTGDEPADSYSLPESYAALIAGRAVLAYVTDALESPLRIAGPLSLVLHASSSQPDTIWFAKIFDVSPDGTARMVSRGLLKASFRALDPQRSLPGQPYHPFDRQDLLIPDEIYRFEIELVPMVHTLKTGHRLRLEIASEDLAYNNPLRQIDVQLLPWPVTNHILHDAAHPSHLLLPVQPAHAGEAPPVDQRLAAIDWPVQPGSWSPHTKGWPLLPAAHRKDEP